MYVLEGSYIKTQLFEVSYISQRYKTDEKKLVLLRKGTQRLHNGNSHIGDFIVEVRPSLMYGTMSRNQYS